MVNRSGLVAVTKSMSRTRVKIKIYWATMYIFKVLSLNTLKTVYEITTCYNVTIRLLLADINNTVMCSDQNDQTLHLIYNQTVGGHLKITF